MAGKKKINKNDEVIVNITKFLKSEKNELMEQCYSSIRDNDENRCYNDSLKQYDILSFDKLFPLVTVVIITANKFECDSLNYIFSENNCSVIKRISGLPIFPNTHYCAAEAYIIKSDNQFLLHLNAFETGSNTPGGSTDLVRYVSNNKLLNPKLIISFGICYGRDPKEQEIGNVLIPKKLYPWSVGQKVIGNKLDIKHDDFNLNLEREFGESTPLYSYFRTFCNGEDGTTIKKQLSLKKTTSKKYAKKDFSIFMQMCNMSTGEAVVSSKKLKEQIRIANKNDAERGGEMEGYGLAKECVYYAKMPCFMIKSICDWGEYKNIDKVLSSIKNVVVPQHLKDKLQAYSAFCAGICLITLFNEYIENSLEIELIEWMADKKRGNKICDSNNHLKKPDILRNIKAFYSIKNDFEGEELAETILDTLLENEIVKYYEANETYTTRKVNR